MTEKDQIFIEKMVLKITDKLSRISEGDLEPCGLEGIKMAISGEHFDGDVCRSIDMLTSEIECGVRAVIESIDRLTKSITELKK
jgi:hypothetical protein